jgi:hypothetical protein
MTAGDLTETIPTCVHTAARAGAGQLPQWVVIRCRRRWSSAARELLDQKCASITVYSEAARRQMERGAPRCDVTPLT